ncbi:Autotransporter outer membrane beta-barrel domain-containing protein [Methylocella tundrae]|uniref:Autotransporter outer membrane beta-barrel domain-containing protein n=1 Tax=Methylocella tundrae TaxID=227605 RepID=A0A8B6M4F8_METTU|nr:outer membrane protein [Methylocella tundrae]VTZ49728.1 Autotransporter outer membrane beta-barrel domain-containing protein [Methylocella tundrae]
MLRRILLASVGAIALAGSAFAADLPSRAPPPVYVPPVPIFTWTGVYIGGQIGYAWGKTNSNIGDAFGDYAAFSTNNSGVIGGAHVGYNLQLSQFVVGLEGDVDGSSMSKSISGVVGGVPTTVSSNMSVQGSIRGRVGYAWDRVLIYGTGGVAFAGLNGSISTPFGYDSASSTRVGWTVGGGLEYAVTNNWSIRAEYRYADFGHSTVYANNSFVGLGAYANRRITENRVQVGFSYKFDTFGPPAPVVAKY